MSRDLRSKMEENKTKCCMLPKPIALSPVCSMIPASLMAVQLFCMHAIFAIDFQPRFVMIKA